MCISGNAELITPKGHSMSLNFGETALVPASLGNFDVQTSGAQILEVIVP
jgi:mannose-6-phosphate isomerase class I